MQLHGEPLPDVVEALDVAGAEVVEVPVYRWVPPADIAPAGPPDSTPSSPAGIDVARLHQRARRGQPAGPGR